MRTFAPISKLDTACAVVAFLNTHKLTMTYEEFAKIVQHPQWLVGDLLDDVNTRHKMSGGKDMITACIVTKRGRPGDGYHACARSLGLESELTQ
jgi:hypothetical protein